MLPTISTGNVASALAGEYQVANSLRFNEGSSDFLSRTPSSASNRKTWTWSGWLKMGAGSNGRIFGSGTSGTEKSEIAIAGITNTSGLNVRLRNDSGDGNKSITLSALQRDPSAWYHIVVAVDTTQGTDTNRVKIYLNGALQTSFSSASYPGLNVDTYINSTNQHNVGALYSGSTGSYYDGYLAECVFIDGQQLDATSFGEFDSDTPTIWKPKDVSGLTFGTNGFYLDFENASSLGADVSGNSNNFTVNNLTSADQSTDTCTNNFATINSLENYYTPHTLSDGNLKQTTASSSNYAPSISTIALSQGKWYFECKYVSRSTSDNYNLIGVKSTQVTNTNYLGQNQHDYGYYSSSGKYYTNGSAVNYGNSYDQGDIIGVYLDLDNNKLYFAKNGALQNSGTGISITDPASTPLGHYFFATGDYGSSLVIVNDWNFGGTQSFSISSGNTDPNGYGNFEYDPSSGTFDGGSKSFYALNTKNLAEFG